jgi:hypothetical protein
MAKHYRFETFSVNLLRGQLLFTVDLFDKTGVSAMTINLNAGVTNALAASGSSLTPNQSAKAMFAALKSGDLAGAQKALTSFTAGQSSGSILLNPNTIFGQLSSAIKAGNLSQAQALSAQMMGGQALPSSTGVSSQSTGSSSGTTSSSGNSSNLSSNPQVLASNVSTQAASNLFQALDAQDASTTSSDPMSMLFGQGSNVNLMA